VLTEDRFTTQYASTVGQPVGCPPICVTPLRSIAGAAG
jgi:hypothetical protein